VLVQVIVPRPATTERTVAIVPASVPDGLSDQQHFTTALSAAVADGIQQTSEGVRAWAHRHGPFTSGHLLARVGEPALERCLAHRGIRHHKRDSCSSTVAAWRFDDVLGRI
jgi:hypothetical protein